MPTPAPIWKAQNPERARELQRRANAAFRARQRRLRDLLLEATTTQTEKEEASR